MNTGLKKTAAINTVKLAIIFLMISGNLLYKGTCQALNSAAFKTLTVSDGLPQSFVSGLVQDSVGFIWIGTRDGLARYDGKKFKVFRHNPADTATLTTNTILSLYLSKQGILWILYETGDIDIMNTHTEKVTHFTNDPLYKRLYNVVKSGHSIEEDYKGNLWILSRFGDVFICNMNKQELRYYSQSELGLMNNKIVGISSYKGAIVLVTDTALITIDENKKILQQINYKFPNPHLYNAKEYFKDIYALFRRNGEIVMHDQNRIIIYKPSIQSFTVIPLKERSLYSVSILEDYNGQVYFDNNQDIYTITAADEVRIWRPKSQNPRWGFKSILLDRSGVLWLGSNGAGIQLTDLRLSRLPALIYERSFHEDILKNYLRVPAGEIKNSFLNGMHAYRFRWLADHNGKIWFSRADENSSKQPFVCYYRNGHLVQPVWHYTDTISSKHAQINTMGFSKSGKLWGIDFYMRPVYFNMLTSGVTAYSSIANVNFDFTYTANSLLIDGEDKFWITTSLDGLFFYDRQTGKTIHYAQSEAPGSLPVNQLMNMVQDPKDQNILWIGSLGGGLIRFNKITGKCNFYTENDGLPNNTVYAVIADTNGMLWCSSNNGIFSFNPVTRAVQLTFTVKDGLPGDEFNRYHFIKLPDSRIAFGGVDGYTIFNPLDIENDVFQPTIALTGININNVPADFGSAGSPFNGAINSLDEITLDHNHNFLTFEFAALEYNITEKLQYRYMLENLDRTWVHAKNINIATYTKIPPGHYVLKIDATNTVGRWSKNFKTLKIVIEPPFWQTWWFIALLIVATAAFVYFMIRYRIGIIRREERQKLEFEREASELKAQALRAQMNPHFIFNCLNSIKACIQEDNKIQAINYLTSFSKLIRSMLNNVEQEIALSEELETCRLYTQLEALRFSSKIKCEFDVEKDLNLRSIFVPPLILQPFIENAIWHGILPKDGGIVTVSVIRKNQAIECIIDDNGIGREMAMRNKSQTTSTYESKGMKLVKNRLNLYNSIHNKGGSIEVIDKKDKNNNPQGTIVIVKFKEEE